MGDISKGVCKMLLFFFQSVVLFPDTQHHFSDFTLQDGKLSFLRFRNKQMVGIMKHEINLLGNLHKAFVSGFCKHEESCSEGKGRKQGKNPCGYIVGEPQRHRSSGY